MKIVELLEEEHSSTLHGVLDQLLADKATIGISILSSDTHRFPLNTYQNRGDSTILDGLFVSILDRIRKTKGFLYLINRHGDWVKVPEDRADEVLTVTKDGGGWVVSAVREED